MLIDQEMLNKVQMLDLLAMEYETSVEVFAGGNYLEDFYDYYEIKKSFPKLIPSPDSFHETLRELSGDDVWQPIAEKTESLFGAPIRVTVFEDDTALRREMEGTDGLAPFFFVFGLMFCEYDGFTLCFISGSNN